MNCPGIVRIVGCLTVLLAMGAAAGVARAQDLRGRVRLDYQNQDRMGWNSSLLFQEYNVTAVDELFVKNIMTVNLRWNRLDDFLLHQAVDQPRLRLGLRGVAYDLSLLYTPPHYSSVGQRLTGEKADNFLATWQYRPEGHPQLRFEYRESKRTIPQGELRKVLSASRQRLFQLDHDVGPVRFGGSYRVRNASGSFSGTDREIRSGLLRASVHQQLGRTFKGDLSADYQRTDTDQYGRTDLIRTANLHFGTMWTPHRKVMASAGGFLRDIVSEQGTFAHSVNNSRELALRAVYRPSPPLQLEARRDLRRTRDVDNTLYSDLVRLQGSYAGTVRKGLQGRLNLVKNITVRTENIATPSDNADLTLDFKLYRRTTMRGSLAMSRRQHLATGAATRYSSLATMEVRSRLTRKVIANLTYRTSNISQGFEFLGSDVHNLSAGMNYTSPRGLTFAGTLRRTYFADSPIAPQTSVNTNLALRFNPNITLNLDGSWNEAGTIQGVASTSTFNSRLQLRLGRTTSAVLGYQETYPSAGFKSRSVTGSLTANF